MPLITCESKGQFDTLLRESGNTLIVVDFTATWCGPCQIIAPKFAELSNTHPDAVFIKVDVDKHRDIATEYKISAMPTFVFIKNGKTLEEFKGADVEKLKQKIQQHK